VSCGSSMHASLFRSLVAAHFLLVVSGMAGKSLLKSTTPRMAALSLLVCVCLLLQYLLQMGPVRNPVV
jgi:hypothetical protein